MNINEIAKLAGVSRATVSRYLNNGYVSDEKKERIQEVIDRTGYKPSTQAQTLRTKKTRLIGVILPKINSDSISRMVAGISVVLKEAGYQLLLANTENREKEELEYLRLFSENHVDGIILIATIITREHKRALKALQVPVVLLGQRLDGYSCVYQDDCLAARDVSRLLLRGAGKIGCIGVTQQDEAVGAGRRKGFLEAAGDAGIAEDAVSFLETGFPWRTAIGRWISCLPCAPVRTLFSAPRTVLPWARWPGFRRREGRSRKKWRWQAWGTRCPAASSALS